MIFITTIKTVFAILMYFDSHPEHQEEIMPNSWGYWNMTLDEMIDKLGE